MCKYELSFNSARLSQVGYGTRWKGRVTGLSAGNNSNNNNDAWRKRNDGTRW